MASDGQRVAARALRYEGLSEPLGRNDGVQIELWQDRSGRKYGVDYTGAPWCAIFIDNMAVEAGVEIDPMLTHPFTGFICQRADELGGLSPAGDLWPVGAWIIYCGVHVGIVVRDRGNGLVDTIEGNAGNAVRRLVREKSRARCIAWPGVGDATGAVLTRPSFGFDDLAKKPLTYGPWATKKARDAQMESYTAPSGAWGPVPVKLDKEGSQFAFRVGRPGVEYGEPWRYGGWRSNEVRRRMIASYLRANPDAKIRIWRREVPLPSGGASADVSTT